MASDRIDGIDRLIVTSDDTQLDRDNMGQDA